MRVTCNRSVRDDMIVLNECVNLYASSVHGVARRGLAENAPDKCPAEGVAGRQP
jgi:hypothetical protein